MILANQYLGFYNPTKAVEEIDWDVVFLLGGMMTIVAIMIPTGGFLLTLFTSSIIMWLFFDFFKTQYINPIKNSAFYKINELKISQLSGIIKWSIIIIY